MTPGITPGTTDASSPFTSWKVDHVGIRVPDLDTAVTWYTEKLDFRRIHSTPLGSLTFAVLSLAGDDRSTFELLAGPGADNRPPYTDLQSSYKMAGWHHVAFRVDSVDGAVDHLKRRGVTIVTEPRDVGAMGLRVAFFADPWGNIFEMIQSLSDCPDAGPVDSENSQPRSPEQGAML
ncbi:MAG TPA: VOC family protein [Acidobacteriaceae bacterium]|jgi:glyoxylase I family protein|nr:VOC family protein [Acidobacteriaceae bacterium]